ncbi:hypothetical protein C0J52_22135 [Blattella germanica]|nr:hypothetical protein C0J52_22135 [Blattella germanica]
MRFSVHLSVRVIMPPNVKSISNNDTKICYFLYLHVEVSPKKTSGGCHPKDFHYMRQTMCEENVLIEREELNIYHVVIGQNIMFNRAFLSNH